MENDEDQTELQLLPSPFSIPSSSRLPPESSSLKYRSGADNLAPSLDLKLSISLEPIQPQNQNRVISGSVEALKWQAAKQIRLAAMEKAYLARFKIINQSRADPAAESKSRDFRICGGVEMASGGADSIGGESMGTGKTSPMKIKASNHQN